MIAPTADATNLEPEVGDFMNELGTLHRPELRRRVAGAKFAAAGLGHMNRKKRPRSRQFLASADNLT